MGDYGVHVITPEGWNLCSQRWNRRKMQTRYTHPGSGCNYEHIWHSNQEIALRAGRSRRLRPTIFHWFFGGVGEAGFWVAVRMTLLIAGVQICDSGRLMRFLISITPLQGWVFRGCSDPGRCPGLWDFALSGRESWWISILTGVENAIPEHTRCKRVRENVIRDFALLGRESWWFYILTGVENAMPVHTGMRRRNEGFCPFRAGELMNLYFDGRWKRHSGAYALQTRTRKRNEGFCPFRAGELVILYFDGRWKRHAGAYGLQTRTSRRNKGFCPFGAGELVILYFDGRWKRHAGAYALQTRTRKRNKGFWGYFDPGRCSGGIHGGCKPRSLCRRKSATDNGF